VESLALYNSDNIRRNVREDHKGEQHLFRTIFILFVIASLYTPWLERYAYCLVLPAFCALISILDEALNIRNETKPQLRNGKVLHTVTITDTSTGKTRAVFACIGDHLTDMRPTERITSVTPVMPFEKRS